MTTAEMLRAKLAEWRPAGAGRHSFTTQVPERGWAVALSADRVETLGCLVWEMSLGRDPSGASLSEAAARFAAKAEGLLEPLAIHEIDEGLGEALLRSERPASEGGAVSYYELKLRGPEQLVLRRFRATTAPGGRREQVAFALTHEAIARLVDTLTA